ncbi:hypothetical protein OKW38_000546 [Paraburkholderia sp. MM5496-R1]|uniref:hypothetical protein n=1 Tax=unclassified Paraburkholderia TaxID=2615204 RepID=UPI003D211824
MVAEHGTVTLDSVNTALGSGNVRVKQFIVQQSEDDPALDEVQIGLSRATSSEFTAICSRLEAMPGAQECRHHN